LNDNVPNFFRNFKFWMTTCQTFSEILHRQPRTWGLNFFQTLVSGSTRGPHEGKGDTWDTRVPTDNGTCLRSSEAQGGAVIWKIFNTLLENSHPIVRRPSHPCTLVPRSWFCLIVTPDPREKPMICWPIYFFPCKISSKQMGHETCRHWGVNNVSTTNTCDVRVNNNDIIWELKQQIGH
jgi:hypothetical protein